MSTKNTNKMATWPVGKLLISMGLPAVFSMLIQALYNVVDSIYVSTYSKDAMFAIGLINPLYMVGLSIALGGAAGICTSVSRKLGEGNDEEARVIASNGFTLTFIHMLVVIAMGLFISKPFLSLFTNRADIIDLGYSYGAIVMGVCVGQQFALYYERLFQSQGNMIIPMIAQLIGALTNIILDPIMIFGRFGFPELGIAGAAIATVIGQILSLIFLVAVTIIKKPHVAPEFKYLKLQGYTVSTIYQVGLPTMVMNMIGSVTTTSLNSILVRFSEDAVTSLSIYFKLQSFIFMPVFGFNQGALPILSFNYGARDKVRYLGTVKLFLLIAEGFMLAGTLLFVFRPDIPLSFFDTDESLLITAEMVLKTVALSFLFAGPNIVITTILQSFAKGTLSMVQSILRQLGLLIPIAWVLSNISLNAVFYAYPISEFIMLLIFLPIAVKTYRTNLG